MNLGLENLIADETIERSQVDLREIEQSLDKQVREWTSEMDREDKLEMVGTIAECLAAAKEEDDSLMAFVKGDLEALGINCESNATAAAELKSFLENNEVDTSQEFLIVEAIVAGIVGLYILAIASAIIFAEELEDWTAEMSAENDQVIDKGLRKEPKNENKEVNVVVYDRWTKYLAAHAAALKVFADNAKEFSSTDMDKIHQIMKSVGIVWQGKDYKHVDEFAPIKQTIEKAGWTPETCKKGHQQFKSLAMDLAVFKKLRADADKAMKEAKKVDTKGMEKEEKAEAKKAAKEKAADMKQAAKELKTYLRVAKSEIQYCGWTLNIALNQYAK